MTENMALYRVSPDHGGLSQIAAIMALHEHVESVHLVSHGVPGALVLGDGQLDTAGLIRNAALLRSIGDQLAPGADLLLYGCDVAAGEAGQFFVDTLAHLTGANVAASDNATGDSVHGGDWILETTSGFIKTPVLHLVGLPGTLSTPGNDTIVGTAGNDTLYGGDGNDQISAQAGDDELYGEAGDDSLAGFDGNDSLYGGLGNDLLLGLNQDDFLSGGDGNDTLSGGAGNDILFGDDGNDVLRGGTDDDVLYGGAGNDTLSGEAGNDTLYGGAGIDTLTGGTNNDIFFGSAADFDGDTITDFSMADSIVVTGVDLSALNGTAASAALDMGGGQSLALTGITGASGNFSSIFSGGNTTITLVAAPTGPATVALTTGADAPALTSFDDTITAGLASSLNAGDAINGQGGTDTLEISAAQTVVLGATTLTNVETITITAGIQNITTHDATVGTGQTLVVDASASTDALTWIGSAETDGLFSITGGSVNDLIRGGAGADTLHGGDGNDTLSGDAGSDLFYGEGNNDTVYGGAGLDTLSGGAGNDFLYGETDNDLIYGDEGNDGLSGGSGDDTIYGGTGNDTLIGSDGNDSLVGGDGNDWIWGQNSDDVIYGDLGSDTLSGDAGSDTLYGGDGDDTLSGGADNDILYGGDGNDALRGNAGNDTLHGDAGNDAFSGSAAELDGDTIADFSLDDSIVVTGTDLSALKGTTASGTITLGTGQSLTLTGITAGSGTFDAVFSGGNTTITLVAPVPEPEPEPPVVEQIDGVSVQTTEDAAGNQTVTIPVVTAARQDDPNTALATHAEVPVATSSSGQTLLTLGVPVGSGVTVQGPAAPLAPSAATSSLLQSIAVTTAADPTAVAAMNESARTWFESLPTNSVITVKTIVPTNPSLQPSSAPLLITGTSGLEAVLVDARSLPQGTVLHMDNIDFAAIVGSATIHGGAGSNYVVGDDASQVIILGMDDDNLHGGGGNDTVGSLAGNDQTFGDAGNDKVYGGAGHDSLSGGLGNDSLNGGFGFDTALAADTRADYDIAVQGDTIVLTHLTTGEIDRLTDVEQVHFSDGEVLTIAHDQMEAVAWHLVSTWLHRNLTLEEAEQVQSINKGASIENLVQAFKALLAPENVKQLGTAELLAGLEDNPAIIRLSEQRQAYLGDAADNQGYLPMGLALAVDGAGGHDVLRLEGGRDDYDLQANDDVLLITRYEDGAMFSLRNAEMLSFDSGETTVLAHGTVEGILGRLVQTFFGRSASVEEWQLGRTALADGVGPDQILDWFEDRAGLELLGDSDYIQALYQNTFGRQANATELQAQLARLDDQDFDRSLLAIDIAQSEEAITTVGSVVNFDNWI